MGDKYYVTDTDNLERIIRAGHQAGYNRQLGTDLALNPGAMHKIDDEFIHKHIAGREVTPHYRVRLGLCTTTNRDPVTAYIDMSREDRKTFTKREKNATPGEIDTLPEWPEPKRLY